MISFLANKAKKILLVLVLWISFAPWCAVSADASEAAAPHLLQIADYSSIKVFDRNGRFVGRIPAAERYWASLDHIPRFLQKAVVAVEDARFYEHGGIDVRGIARALVKDVMKGKMVEGGSTITQQLIKNRYLSGEKTIDRKMKEARLAMEFERKYTKKQILEMYFNEIYYGNGAWGIVQAARLYFDKNPEQLTDAECALLAGVPKAPARYNPLGKAPNVLARRDVVLQRMVELGMITPLQKQRLRAQRVTFTPPSQVPQFLAFVRSRLVERYGKGVVEQGGLDIFVAMDLDVQNHAQQVLREGVERLSPELQGALVCLDPLTGDVLAAVGSVDPGQNTYNRAFYARRQPGSAIKPFIYAAAVEKGITAASMWSDAPEAYNRGNGIIWQPHNYGNERYGLLTLRQALAYSNNIITVKLLDTIGVDFFASFADKLGVPQHENHDLSIALGTTEVTPIDLVSAYTSFVNNGIRSKPRTIIRIYDRRLHVWTENPPQQTAVFTPAAAFVTTQMLKDVLVYGTAKSLAKFSLEQPSAGKTGTTDDYRDAWFVGYTPRFVAGVWVGYDKPRPGGKGFTGGGVCAPIWSRFMSSLPTAKPAADFVKPDTVISVSVDPATGYLATASCPDRRAEFFSAGTEPTEYCPEHGAGSLENGVQGDNDTENMPGIDMDGSNAIPRETTNSAQ